MAGSPDPSSVVVGAAPVAASQNITVQQRTGLDVAFQPNAFQVPGFQTQFSQQAFQRCAFQYSGFQTDECTKDDGRSGYWRLFFTQMQEEALKNEVKEAAQNAAEEVVTQAIKTPAKPKPKKKLEPLVKLENYDIPKFKRKPIYSDTKSINDAMPLWLANVSIEIDQWYASFIPLWNEHRRVIIKSKQDAANDADHRLRLLLLLAA